MTDLDPTHAQSADNAMPFATIMQGPDSDPPIYNDRIFMEFRDLLGDDCATKALADLAGAVEQAFSLPTPEGQDRQQIFRRAHLVVGRAGIMGFPLLHARSVTLQDTCQSGDCIAQAYAAARAAGISTNDVIARLGK